MTKRIFTDSKIHFTNGAIWFQKGNEPIFNEKREWCLAFYPEGKQIVNEQDKVLIPMHTVLEIL